MRKNGRTKTFTLWPDQTLSGILPYDHQVLRKLEIKTDFKETAV